jgi:2,4-dienoyl-CoA reductase-like NADH-dependent reductase (Old Yellow Enzyme family)
MTDKPSAAPRPLLFTPITIRGVTAKNRIVVSPMCQYHSVDGGPTDWQLIHLGRLAMGGSGIVFGEETAVEDRGRKSYDCAGIWDDKHIPQYRRITDFIRAQDAVPAIQLGHAGRKASCHGAVHDFKPLADEDAADGLPPWQGISASPLFEGPRRYTPKEMDRDDIRTVLDSWREATRRSEEAGYDFLEVHGAHGYLIHQFLSPCSNQRTDAYGGDLQGRMRFALEVAEVVRDAWPDKPLSWRASCVDGAGGRWNLEDTVVLARELKDRGIDMIDCSSGGVTGESNMPAVPRVPGFQVGFSERIRRDVDIPTIAVGLITEPQQAEDILQSGKADLVALARELLANAEWPVLAAKALGVDDPFGAMPLEYAHRLRLREKQKAMPINQGGEETQAAMRAHLGQG